MMYINTQPIGLGHTFNGTFQCVGVVRLGVKPSFEAWRRAYHCAFVEVFACVLFFVFNMLFDSHESLGLLMGNAERS
jgi:hypothetical protein